QNDETSSLLVCHHRSTATYLFMPHGLLWLEAPTLAASGLGHPRRRLVRGGWTDADQAQVVSRRGGRYPPITSHCVSCRAHRRSVCGVRVLRWACDGNRRTPLRRTNERLAAQSGHSTPVIPLVRNRCGAISTTPAKGHFFVGTAGTCSPTGSRRAARAIRALVRGLDVGSGTACFSKAPGASPRVRVSLPGSGAGWASNCCSSCALWALARSTLCSPVRASISIRTRWSGCKACRVSASSVKVVAPS